VPGRAMPAKTAFASLIIGGGAALTFANWTQCESEDDDSWLPGPLKQARDAVNEYASRWTEPSRELLLPGWPSQMGPAPRTLVLDLDETLVHTTWDRKHGWRTQRRPYLDKFLRTLVNHYEIVVFSCGLMHTVDPVIGAIDPNQQLIMYRLYRDSSVYRKGKYIKDLSRLNRDLNRVVMIDDSAEHCADQPENAIIVPRFEGDKDDIVLMQLIPLLKGMAENDVPDVREEIERYRKGGTTEDLLRNLDDEMHLKYQENQAKLKSVEKLPGSRIWKDKDKSAQVMDQMRAQGRSENQAAVNRAGRGLDF